MFFYGDGFTVNALIWRPSYYSHSLEVSATSLSIGRRDGGGGGELESSTDRAAGQANLFECYSQNPNPRDGEPEKELEESGV